MARRGRSTTIGKFAKLCQDRRVSEIRGFGELLRREQAMARAERADQSDAAHPTND
jgi:hypothetical protein